ncbi:CSEP0134 putative effector protein [Blumeria hordei DH14]|uniref:CSEP0134 putative effector protein n=1 Tax=Blumeria graminis f. sp. hordei (strain DH14) TaxID=546991 RepID=N1JGG0_BLUG1|nr:CSEP0134 putative effector protein [Blumeria hordei DH14]
MQFFRSALVVSLSMLSVSAIILDGVYRCPGLGYDLDAKEVAQKVDSININAEKEDWYDFEENGVQYKNIYHSVVENSEVAKHIFIKANKNKDVVAVGVHQTSEMIQCQHIPAEVHSNKTSALK